MIKILNRVVCFVIAFVVLLVMVLSFPVRASAEDSESFTLYPSPSEVSDYSGINIEFMKSYLRGKYSIVSDYLYYPKYPKFCFNLSGEENVVIDASDYKQCLDFCLFSSCSMPTNQSKDLYYYAYVKDTHEIDERISVIILYSSSFIYFKTTDNKNFSIYSENTISYSTFNFFNQYSSYQGKSYTHLDSVGSLSGVSLTYDINDTSYLCPSYSNILPSGVNHFIIPFKSLNFPNFLTNATKDGVESSPGQSLKDQIEVKLTPEFKIGMDRSIPNSAFNTSEDYWKLEVTNYNSCNIQFKCYVIPATGDVPYVDEWGHSDSLKEMAKGIPIDVNTDDFIPKVPDKTVWMLEKNQWIYSKETASQEEYQNAEPYLVNKPTSVFFLESCKSFTQMIKWNQLNINKNQPYQLLVTACECPYDKASDIHISLASDNYSQSLKHIIKESYYIVSDITFSIKNPLVYNSNENYGGVIPNTGRQQVDEDYWKINAIEKDGEIEVRNADYVNGWRLNPDGSSKYDHWNDDIDLDNIGIDNVRSYITYSKNFFNLIGSVISVFPSYIWSLICFGLTALIVIGIFKALL